MLFINRKEIAQEVLPEFITNKKNIGEALEQLREFVKKMSDAPSVDDIKDYFKEDKDATVLLGKMQDDQVKSFWNEVKDRNLKYARNLTMAMETAEAVLLREIDEIEAIISGK